MYRGIIGSISCLTARRPDIIYSVGVCAWLRLGPKKSHMKAVKRILKQLKGSQELGLWYSRSGNFELVGFADTDYDGYLV